MKKIIAAVAVVGAVSVAALQPAIAADEALPSKTECDATALALYPVMGQALTDGTGQPRFTESEIRGRIQTVGQEQLAGVLGNDFGAMLGTAKLSKDAAHTALLCGLAKKDPERINASSSELTNVLASLGVKLPF